MKKYVFAGLITASFVSMFALGVRYAGVYNCGFAMADESAVEEKAIGVVESIDMSKGILVIKKSHSGDRLSLEVESGKLDGLKVGDKVKVQYHKGEKNVAFYLRKMAPKIDVGC